MLERDIMMDFDLSLADNKQRVNSQTKDIEIKKIAAIKSADSNYDHRGFNSAARNPEKDL